MHYWDWQKDVFTSRVPIGQALHPYQDDSSDVLQIRTMYIYVSKELNCTEDDIMESMSIMPDELLKICMLHQPLLAELISDILMSRECRR